MFRNGEIKAQAVCTLLLALICTAAGFVLSVETGLLILVCSLLFIGLTMTFTHWRYGKIRQLNDYLKRINNGDYALDVRDNTEGELSILKTEIYKVTVMLKNQNEALRTDKAAMQNALSDISHQLKTPLTSMFVMTDLLMDEGLPEDKRCEFTDRIRVQLERLQWLVAALLKLSRLDAKTVEFKRETIPTKMLLDKACAPLLIPMDIKNITLDIEDYGAKLCCDSNWTAEAVLNILKNCVEYTPENGIIGIMCAENPLFTQIRIKDSGPGIYPADLPHIFERFYRGKNAGDDSVGIGLAMAAAIVQEQGGSIDAANAKEGGSIFTIRFPK